MVKRISLAGYPDAQQEVFFGDDIGRYLGGAIDTDRGSDGRRKKPPNRTTNQKRKTSKATKKKENDQGVAKQLPLIFFWLIMMERGGALCSFISLRKSNGRL